VIVGVVSSAIAAYFYVRVIVLMFFDEPDRDAPTVVVPSVLTTVAVAAGAVMTVVLGVFPQPLLDLADRVAVFLG
jgi:NADH-quinone oxidoreductase subunit N